MPRGRKRAPIPTTKIGICGAHGTGKSTLIKALAPHYPTFHVFDSASNQVRSEGHVVNEGTGDQTQLAILRVQARNADYGGNAIYDRTIVDAYSYTVWAYINHKVGHGVHSVAKKMLDDNIGKYDYLFLLQPEFPIIDNGLRSLNTSYQEEINDQFLDVLNTRTYTNVSGTVEERVQQIVRVAIPK